MTDDELRQALNYWQAWTVGRLRSTTAEELRQLGAVARVENGATSEPLAVLVPVAVYEAMLARMQAAALALAGAKESPRSPR